MMGTLKVKSEYASKAKATPQICHLTIMAESSKHGMEFSPSVVWGPCPRLNVVCNNFYIICGM